MPITLTFSDAQDGTGGTATVAGSTGGTSNVVYTMSATQALLSSPSWVNSGSRTGDGAVTLTLTSGYYWAYVENNDAGNITFSPLIYCAVTDSADPLIERCAAAIESVLSGLTMAGNPNANIYRRSVPSVDSITLPCIEITYDGEIPREIGGQTGSDDLILPINVRLYDEKITNYETRRSRYVLWQQQIWDALRNKRLSGITEVYNVQVSPMAMAPGDTALTRRFVTGVTAECVARKVRV